jgi:hypothetical protein
LRNSRVEELLETIDSAKEETHAQYKKQVGEHTANQGRLDDDDLFVRKRNDTNDEFNGITTQCQSWLTVLLR